MKVQNTTTISPVERDNVLEKMDTLNSEGYESVTVTLLDEGEYGLSAVKVVEE